jgi:hypothetical protein
MNQALLMLGTISPRFKVLSFIKYIPLETIWLIGSL